MTIPLTGAQSLFVRLGHQAGNTNSVNTYRGTTLLNNANTVRGDFTSTDLALMDSLYSNLDAAQQAMSSWPTAMQTLAQATLIKMVDDDSPQQPQLDLSKSAQILIAQMIANSQSIARPTLSASVAYTKPDGTSNTGNGVVVTSTKDPADGNTLDMMFTETIRGTCTADGYTGGGGATPGEEPFSVLGQPATNSALDSDWPQGSGASVTINSTAAASTSSEVTDGSFQTWSGSPLALTNWSLRTGVWGTDVKQNSSPFISSQSYNLRFVGDGSTLSAIYQAVTLSPLTTYAVALPMKMSGVAAGVMEISLTNTAYTVQNDAAGTANTISQTLSALSGSYAFTTGFFRTGAVLPATVYLQIRISTAITNTATVDVGYCQMIPATQLYAGGPFVGIFQGATDWATNDYFSIAASNSKGVTSWARQQDVLFGFRSLGLKLPSVTGAAETIADSLITV